MKAIISHDVDHIDTWEHRADLIIPKFLVRSAVELLRGGISTSEFRNRLSETFITRKWQNIEDLIRYDRQCGVPATFFVAVNRGLGLSYSQHQASYWIKKILQAGFDVGVHGICFHDLAGIEKEYRMFSEISGLQNFGIRMHYLRMEKYTLEMLSHAGYMYDATVYDLTAPFRVGNLIEFPLQIREAKVLYPYSTFRTVPLQEAIGLTKQSIDLAIREGLPYLTVLFHDRYFSASFQTWLDWYKWLIQYLKSCGIPLISYKQAAIELGVIQT